jgi:hypothetical protein
MISQSEESQLKDIVAETEQRFQDLEQENRRLRNEIEKQSQYQSAFQSNSQACYEKVEILERQNRENIEKL